jgi:hypothetical protein
MSFGIAGADDAKPKTLVVPAGTSITIQLRDELSSGTAKADDTFAFKAAQDVVVNGYVVIAKGAPGQGTVVSSEPAGGNGHPGKMALQFDYIFSVDGYKIKLSDTPSTAEGEQKKGATSTAAIVGYATLGIGGLFAHNFVKGRDMVIDPKQKFDVYSSRTVHVRSTEAGDPNDAGFAK